MEKIGVESPYTTEWGRYQLRWGYRTYVMGIINVTPDSFSGDGLDRDLERVLARAVQMVAYGADIIDVGGESTRPPSVYSGAQPISAGEEIERVLPVIEILAKTIDVPISIDTCKAEVARHALEAGASMVNDVWGGAKDSGMAPLVAKREVPFIMMHNQENTVYTDLIPEMINSLAARAESALAAGVKKENIIIDPGIGFGKTWEHNLVVMQRLRDFKTLGFPILMGTSRKSFIGRVLELPVEDRLEGTAATVALSIAGGADIVRVHDVKEMVRVSRMTDAIVRGRTSPIPARDFLKSVLA